MLCHQVFFFYFTFEMKNCFFTFECCQWYFLFVVVANFSAWITGTVHFSLSHIMLHINNVAGEKKIYRYQKYAWDVWIYIYMEAEFLRKFDWVYFPSCQLVQLTSALGSVRLESQFSLRIFLRKKMREKYIRPIKTFIWIKKELIVIWWFTLVEKSI